MRTMWQHEAMAKFGLNESEFGMAFRCANSRPFFSPSEPLSLSSLPSTSRSNTEGDFQSQVCERDLGWIAFKKWVAAQDATTIEQRWKSASDALAKIDAAQLRTIMGEETFTQEVVKFMEDFVLSRPSAGVLHGKQAIVAR
jgi:hypothetical protein